MGQLISDVNPDRGDLTKQDSSSVPEGSEREALTAATTAKKEKSTGGQKIKIKRGNYCDWDGDDRDQWRRASDSTFTALEATPPTKHRLQKLLDGVARFWALGQDMIWYGRACIGMDWIGFGPHLMGVFFFSSFFIFFIIIFFALALLYLFQFLPSSDSFIYLHPALPLIPLIILFLFRGMEITLRYSNRMGMERCLDGSYRFDCDIRLAFP